MKDPRQNKVLLTVTISRYSAILLTSNGNSCASRSQNDTQLSGACISYPLPVLAIKFPFVFVLLTLCCTAKDFFVILPVRQHRERGRGKDGMAAGWHQQWYAKLQSNQIH
eukprot:6184247-Pleurochrysis_carterae.AAC.3